MAFGAYTPDSADKAKTALDRDLKSVEHFLGRIGAAVPQAGATTSRLEDAAEFAREVVSDLHDVIDGRTEVVA
jgi:flagellin-like hook-associated protein FlgL